MSNPQIPDSPRFRADTYCDGFLYKGDGQLVPSGEDRLDKDAAAWAAWGKDSTG